MGKLVRDGIPAMVGAGAVARVLDADEYAAALHAKLKEEVAEYLEAHDPEELADVLEVLHALAALHGWTPAELEAKRVAKAQARGGFGGRVWMEF